MTVARFDGVRTYGEVQMRPFPGGSRSVSPLIEIRYFAPAVTGPCAAAALAVPQRA